MVAAIGRAEFVRGEWLKPGCVVVDVGINFKEDSTRASGEWIWGWVGERRKSSELSKGRRNDCDSIHEREGGGEGGRE